MQPKVSLDLTSAASRRRFFLDHVLRRGSRGSGSNLEALTRHSAFSMIVSGDEVSHAIFGDIPIVLIGAHAVAVYAAARNTADVDYFTSADHYSAAATALQESGYARNGELQFVTSALGLFGTSWVNNRDAHDEIDLISSSEQWSIAALAAPGQLGADGTRVIPLEFLVLMKLDAARSIDQGDLSRMLGRLSDEKVEQVVAVVNKYYSHDPAAADDIRQYAQVGRWEYETNTKQRDRRLES